MWRSTFTEIWVVFGSCKGTGFKNHQFDYFVGKVNLTLLRNKFNYWYPKSNLSFFGWQQRVRTKNQREQRVSGKYSKADWSHSKSVPSLGHWSSNLYFKSRV